MVANVEMDGPRAAKAKGPTGDTRDAEGGRGPFHWLGKLAPTRLTSRIILINFVGLVILVGGILYFNQSRESLIDARVESLMTQGAYHGCRSCLIGVHRYRSDDHRSR